jgi:hypothetical protein
VNGRRQAINLTDAGSGVMQCNLQPSWGLSLSRFGNWRSISLRKVSSCHTLMAQYWTVQSGTEVKLLQRHFLSLNQHLLLEEEAASER